MPRNVETSTLRPLWRLRSESLLLILNLDMRYLKITPYSILVCPSAHPPLPARRLLHAGEDYDAEAVCDTNACEKQDLYLD